MFWLLFCLFFCMFALGCWGVGANFLKICCLKISLAPPSRCSVPGRTASGV